MTLATTQVSATIWCSFWMFTDSSSPTQTARIWKSSTESMKVIIRILCYLFLARNRCASSCLGPRKLFFLPSQPARTIEIKEDLCRIKAVQYISYNQTGYTWYFETVCSALHTIWNIILSSVPAKRWSAVRTLIVYFFSSGSFLLSSLILFK